MVDRALIGDAFAFVAVITGMGCLTGIVITYLKRKGRAIQSGDLSVRLAEIAERLARLENAVDSTALEVERISEGQRFTTRLLSERSGTPARADIARPSGSNTPH